jgi:hypothetical protein
MKAQRDSNIRGRKDFICREENRNTAYWGIQGDQETGDPVDQGGEWVLWPNFALPEGGDAFQM